MYCQVKLDAGGGNVVDSNLSYPEIRAEARKAAAAVMDLYWTPGRFPVDPVQVSRAVGVEVYSAQLGNDTYGMLLSAKAGADMYLDVDQPPNRYRFSCAHELGHYVDRTSSLDAPLEAGFVEVDKRSDDGRGKPGEVYANEFAGSLLMPEDELKSQLDAGTSGVALARYFGVSLSALQYRRQVLGI
ncbi:ImmA/IrrE family metallo-endopeptidase [Pseudoclavibacter sp. 8L]|uniref:ImmA/IrrE family metallo-endopeptidase n=1 Tax=Pseudoclavibacter sp. 8L TaxID=2653162 RepID=UPI00135CBFA1|nr:ImmA/IrrE family metallo-endopeptidase [Pseudoclavibacter sp. 8L]